MDYSRYAHSGKYYGGTGQKKGILIDQESYILKYAQTSEEGMYYTHISEYISSHLFAHVGVDAQQTMLGTCDKHPVVAVKDFVKNGEIFVSFNDICERTLERQQERFRYSFEDIITVIEKNTGIVNKEEAFEHFWNMYIVDAWLGNGDRNGTNWGFVKNNKCYRIAPVYGNATALFPEIHTDEKLRAVLDSTEEMNKRIYQLPVSKILLNGKRSSYYEVINSLSFEGCNQALMRIYERADMEWVKRFINGMEELSPVRKEFYITILQERFRKMLEEPYRRLSTLMNIKRLQSLT